MSASPRPKFRIGQVVQNRYYRDDFIKIRAVKFGAAKNNSDVWAYAQQKAEFGTVWFEENMLRKLTKREAEGR